MGLSWSNLVRVARNLPDMILDRTEGPMRGGRYGEQHVLPLGHWRRGLADEGSLYAVTNPTPGTGIQLNGLVTAFADTNGFLVVHNTEDPSNPSAKRIYFDRLKMLLLATAPTATVSLEFVVKRSKISREPAAAGRTLLTPVQIAGGSGRGSVARVMSYANAAAMTVPASELRDPTVSRIRIPTGLGIAGDEYVIEFGGDDLGPTAGLTATRATAPARMIAQSNPVILEPGEWAVLHRWWLTEATTAPTFEFDFSWYER
jgi:hypothetical protein